MREEFQELMRRTAPNAGQPLLQKTKQEVVFDPYNPDHMEAARILFFFEDTMPDKAKVKEHIEWCYRQEEQKMRKHNLTIKFRLEPPFHDVRSMIVSRIVNWAMDLHTKRYGPAPKARVLKLPRTNV